MDGTVRRRTGIGRYRAPDAVDLDLARELDLTPGSAHVASYRALQLVTRRIELHTARGEYVRATTFASRILAALFAGGSESLADLTAKASLADAREDVLLEELRADPAKGRAWLLAARAEVATKLRIMGAMGEGL